MRWLVALGLVVVACGEEPPPRAVDVPAPLVIPPMDSGASPAPTPTVAATPAPQPTPAPTDEFSAARDPLGQRPQRSVALVQTEAQGLDSLLAATPKGDAQRAQILKRLSDDEFAIARAQSGAEAARTRKRAIGHCTELVLGFPSFAQIDEVYYYAGLGAEQNGDLSNARREYYELIQKQPTSKYVPYAYFAFGEMFRAEAQSDPSKFAIARQAYREVIKYPPPRNPLFPFAQRRIAGFPTTAP